MNVKRIVLSAVAFVLLLAAAAPAVQAAQYWPQVNHSYFCLWTLPNTSGQSLVTFTSLNGNNYYRWGYMTTVYPNGSSLENRVVVTKPDTTSDDFTEYEFTTNTQIQCDFRVYSVNQLEWLNCTNGAHQICF